MHNRAILALVALLALSCGDEASVICAQGTFESGGLCVPSPDLCGPGTRLNPESGQCEAAVRCAQGTVLEEEECVPDGSVICDSGTRYNSETGQCDPDISGCGHGSVLVGDECLGLDEARMASQEEGPEPNLAGLAGLLSTPPLTSDRSVHGCITPTDFDGEGSTDADVDSYLLRALGPTLLDISVDGVGGLAGAFRIRAVDGDLAEDNWERIGLNLVGDTSRRQVFLPIAGDYFLDIHDSRSLLQGLPVGGPQTCYFASIRTVTMPAAIPITDAHSAALGGSDGRRPTVLSYDPIADGDFVDAQLTATSGSAQPAIVFVREGQFAGSEQAGAVLSGRAGGLRANGNLVIVVEPYFHYALDPVSYDLSLSATSVPELQSGQETTVAVGALPAQGMVWTETTAGEIVTFSVDDPDLSVSTVLRDLSSIQTQLCASCSSQRFFYQAKSDGILYLALTAQGAVTSFTATIGVSSQGPSLLALDTPLTGRALGPAGVDFYASEELDLQWNAIVAQPSGFTGDLRLLRYPRSQAGFLDLEVAPSLDANFSDDEPLGQIVSAPEDAQRTLIRITDSAFDATSDTEQYDLSLSTRDFTVMSPLNGNPAVLNAVSLGASDTHHYWIEAGATQVGSRLELLVSNVDTADVSIDLLDRNETSLLSADQTGAAGDETLRFFVPEQAFAPISLRSLAGAGSYSIRASLLGPSDLAFGPGSESTAIGGGTLNQVATVAGACTLSALRVDLDVRGSNIGQMQIKLTSPEGSEVFLHNQTGGAQFDLVGSYPVSLTPNESLDVFAGQEALGEWTLNLQATGFSKTLESWTLALFCQP